MVPIELGRLPRLLRLAYDWCIYLPFWIRNTETLSLLIFVVEKQERIFREKRKVSSDIVMMFPNCGCVRIKKQVLLVQRSRIARGTVRDSANENGNARLHTPLCYLYEDLSRYPTPILINIIMIDIQANAIIVEE